MASPLTSLLYGIEAGNSHCHTRDNWSHTSQQTLRGRDKRNSNSAIYRDLRENSPEVYTDLKYKSESSRKGKSGRKTIYYNKNSRRSDVLGENYIKWRSKRHVLEKSWEEEVFAMTPSSGVLSVAGDLDRERCSWYNLTISATNKVSIGTQELLALRGRLA